MANSKSDFYARQVVALIGGYQTIASSTNATPIVVTTSDPAASSVAAANNFSTADTVLVQSHTTNTNANGVWPVSAVATNTVTLSAAVGNGVGGATGYVRRLTGPAATLYVGLWTAALSDTSTGSAASEVSGGSYARKSVSNSGNLWNAASGSGGNISVSNSATVTFIQATGTWGTVSYVGLLDATSAGNMLYWTQLGTAKTINNLDQASFTGGSPGNLLVQED